jgi:hypothetical protein
MGRCAVTGLSHGLNKLRGVGRCSRSDALACLLIEATRPSNQSQQSRPLDLTVRRSRGFEGMVASKDDSKLYALLEGAMWDAATKETEKLDGREYLRILEFDVASQRWTGRYWKYMLEANGLAIGDFNMIDDTTALVIERDNGESTPDKACPTVDGEHIVVGNDNNLPFSSSREPNRADDNEFVLLRVPQMLQAR